MGSWPNYDRLLATHRGTRRGTPAIRVLPHTGSTRAGVDIVPAWAESKAIIRVKRTYAIHGEIAETPVDPVLVRDMIRKWAEGVEGVVNEQIKAAANKGENI